MSTTSIYAIAWAITMSLFSSQVMAESVSIKHNKLQLNGQWQKSTSTNPVFVIVHGTLAHAGMEITSTLQELLDERDYSSLAINLSLGVDNRPLAPYVCATPHRHKHEDALDEIRAWIDWLEKKGHDSLVLIGHSRGGSQAAMLLQDRPKSIKNAVLIAPATWDKETVHANYDARYDSSIAALLQEIDNKPDDQLLTATDILYCPNTTVSVASLKSYYQPTQNYDSISLLRTVDVPVLVIAGSDDAVVKDLDILIDDQLDSNSHLSFTMIDGADHFFRDLYLEDVVDSIEAVVAKDTGSNQ